MLYFKIFPECNLGFLPHISQEKVGPKECRVGVDKGIPEIKTS